jgi:hypothetical protein
MKAILSSVLILIVLSISWMDLLNITAFYLNQDQLEKFYCENILQPELDCHGKCYLRKTINQDENQNSKIPLPERSETQITYTFEPDPSLTISSFENKPELIGFAKNLYGLNLSNDLLKPPILFLS